MPSVKRSLGGEAVVVGRSIEGLVISKRLGEVILRGLSEFGGLKRLVGAIGN
jgi:hypothetical protein